MSERLNTLGICIGASTVSIVQLHGPAGCGNSNQARQDCSIVKHLERSHGGDPRKTMIEMLQEFELARIDRIVATGRRFRHFVNLSTISEPEAVELAYQYTRVPEKSAPAIVSCGGETFMVYVLDKQGRIANVLTGNKCASGTGEFFTQQLKRMDVTLEDAQNWSSSDNPYAVSGRCSVFCKSDCTHAINKGVPKLRVTAGLCRMMADKVLELVKHISKNDMMLVGGSTRNHMLIDYLQQSLPGLTIPECATYFEATGAALSALDHETRPFPGFDQLIIRGVESFKTLEPLRNYESMVDFKNMQRGTIAAGDSCILGLDVGSTTTKAVLLRTADDSIVASVYLYTHGDPVAASRQCYQNLLDQVKAVTDPASIQITGLGVCGSGRQIAGLHALTDGIINEIIAHAAAAVHFDPEVDTLFEIGGQDAKYTYITNGVPADYAMNEACSAGTGSFLAESAYETLSLPVTEIAAVAIKGDAPPNFNDQCAAFISSDIKTAIHEGVKHENIVAGLVYSICMNYINRVKGNRPVGNKVFMQGGVCYNHAVPLAMAALAGKPIIVPPEPGLMGAFGVALEVKKRLAIGLIEAKNFDLQTLIEREVNYKKSFVCKGGKQNCDRRCEIAVIELEGENHCFGGACNLYYNLRKNLQFDLENLDLVHAREQLVFDTFAPDVNAGPPLQGTIGLNRSFLVETYYPFYATFFRQLGFNVVVPSEVSPIGLSMRNAAFCHPAELAHGYFYSLLQHGSALDYIFLPQVKGIPASCDQENSQVCPFVQAEPYYLSTTFRDKLAELEKQGTVVLKPFIDMVTGIEAAEESMLEVARIMKISRSMAKNAFANAVQRQKACFEAMRELGRQALARLEADPDAFAVVVVGRPYNALVRAGNMGIAHKLASRGVQVIPLDFLPLEEETSKRYMYWGMGQKIMQAARYIKRHKQLFGTYITNFSCGPDSFIIGYFREIMEDKPSLTLELDSHTADAGVETRIEAFLDVIAEYRQILMGKISGTAVSPFIPARVVIDNNTPHVVTSSGKILPMTDPKVKFVLPSMGRLGTELLAAVFSKAGFNVVHHAPADEAALKKGRANTLCKECLPLILTTGKLLNYVDTEKKADEVLVYFMASASGPCRFGQYATFMNDLIKRLQLPDVAILSLSCDNFYAGLGGDFSYNKAWWAIIISDFMEDARSMILANAVDAAEGIAIFRKQWQLIVAEFNTGNYKSMQALLERSADILGDIPMRRPPSQVPTVLVTGEIYVRRDEVSSQYLTERLAEKGFAVLCSPVAEWIHYLEYNNSINESDQKMTWKQRIQVYLLQRLMKRYEKAFNRKFDRSGLRHVIAADVKTVVANASSYVSPKFSGEAILTVGSALTEIGSSVCGVIIIGPFGCMPNRISESILTEIMTREDKLNSNCQHQNRKLQTILADMERLPFLAIETDGSPYPQLIEAKLEAFCLHAERLHMRMMAVSAELPVAGNGEAVRQEVGV